VPDVVAVPVCAATAVAAPEAVTARSHAIRHLYLVRRRVAQFSVAHRAARERVCEQIEAERLAQESQLLQRIVARQQADVGAPALGDPAVEREHGAPFLPRALHQPVVLDRALPRRVEARRPQPAGETPEVVVAEKTRLRHSLTR